MAGLYLLMDYRQVLDYMYTRLPMFSRVGGKAVKSGLDNILALCDVLGNPHEKMSFVHVAGTNGKGSVSHMLAAVLQSAGYNTGLYTSPHLKDFRERIKINGQMISESEVVGFIEKMRPHIEEIEPSFFEITVALAFDHFSRNKTGIAVIETGLGGRLDSTNIINPVLSVITNIGYDHVQILGNTLEEIAAEKAGIIKKAVPVVIGERDETTAPVFQDKARVEAAPIFFAGDDLQVADWQQEDSGLLIYVAEGQKADHRKYKLDLAGRYQTKNLLTVLESCRRLKAAGWILPEAAIESGLKQVKKLTGLHGRWEIVSRHPRIILDVAHNESGMRALLDQLEISSYRRLHIVLGMVKDKDVDTVVKMLPAYAVYYFANAHIPRAMPADELKQKAALYNLQGHVFGTVNEALDEAKAHAHTDDLILVCGSVFLVGEVIV